MCWFYDHPNLQCNVYLSSHCNNDLLLSFFMLNFLSKLTKKFRKSFLQEFPVKKNKIIYQLGREGTFPLAF